LGKNKGGGIRQGQNITKPNQELAQEDLNRSVTKPQKVGWKSTKKKKEYFVWFFTTQHNTDRTREMRYRESSGGRTVEFGGGVKEGKKI